MKWYNNLLLALVIGGIAMCFGLHKGYQLKQQDLEDSEIVAMVEQTQLMSWEQHFPREELLTIHTAAVRNDCKGEDLTILYSIRKAENGPKGLEFGVICQAGTNLDTQAGWAAATVVKTRARWVKAGKPKPFIEYLGDRYCPVGAENDPNGLNKHWINNVKHWHKLLSGKELALNY